MVVGFSWTWAPPQNGLGHDVPEFMAARRKAAQAKAAVEALGAEIRIGAVYTGKVVAIKEFGCFVELAPGTDGMVHVSELAHGFVKKVDEQVKVGDVVTVKVINIDDNGRIKLSRKAMLPAPEATARV